MLQKTDYVLVYALLFIVLFAFSGCKDEKKATVPGSKFTKTHRMRGYDSDGRTIALNCGEYAELIWEGEKQELMIVVKTDCRNLSVGKIYSGKDGSMLVKPSWSTIYDEHEKQWRIFGALIHLEKKEKILLSCGRETGGTCEFTIYTPHQGDLSHVGGLLFKRFPLTIAHIPCKDEWKTVFVNKGESTRHFEFWCKPCKNESPTVRIRGARIYAVMEKIVNSPGEYKSKSIEVPAGDVAQLKCPGTGECQYTISIRP